MEEITLEYALHNGKNVHNYIVSLINGIANLNDTDVEKLAWLVNNALYAGLIDRKDHDNFNDVLAKHTGHNDDDHILVANGDMFDGSRDQFRDCFFSNAYDWQIKNWCAREEWSLTIKDKVILPVK